MRRHSVPSVRRQLGNNSAISLLRVRRHGFVAVEGPGGPRSPLTNSSGCRPADYPGAPGPADLYPGFTTVSVAMPTECNGSLVLAVNAKTSVAGFVQVGVRDPAPTLTKPGGGGGGGGAHSGGERAPGGGGGRKGGGGGGGGGGEALGPYRVCNSDPLRGNMLSATASWGGGAVRALPVGGVGGPAGAVQLEVVLVAAKLFSLQFRCEPAPRA